MPCNAAGEQQQQQQQQAAARQTAAAGAATTARSCRSLLEAGTALSLHRCRELHVKALPLPLPAGEWAVSSEQRRRQCRHEAASWRRSCGARAALSEHRSSPVSLARARSLHRSSAEDSAAPSAGASARCRRRRRSCASAFGFLKFVFRISFFPAAKTVCICFSACSHTFTGLRLLRSDSQILTSPHIHPILLSVLSSPLTLPETLFLRLFFFIFFLFFF